MNDNKPDKQPEATGIRQVAIGKVDTMEKNKNIETTSAEVKETELAQVSGGVNNTIQNELYADGNKIDLQNPDFLSEN